MSATSARTRTVAVIGGGTMGADIAASFVAAGWSCHIVNPPDRMGETLVPRLKAALLRLHRPYPEDGFRVHPTVDTVPWKDVDLVIESVPENLETKRAVFAQLVQLARSDTPLCSNSSAFPISWIGEGLKTQHRMLGTHYFMPAHLIPAVEVVSLPDDSQGGGEPRLRLSSRRRQSPLPCKARYSGLSGEAHGACAVARGVVARRARHRDA